MDNRDDKGSHSVINAKVLEWAREQAACLRKDVAQRLNISESTVFAWEEGLQQPEISDLRNLSIIYNTPFAYFFLKRPPKEVPLKDYRGTPDKIRKSLSRETRLALREFRRLHRLSRILKNLILLESSENLEFLSGNEDIEQIASRERAKLKITLDEKMKWPNKEYAWQSWRNAIEMLGISVFSLRMPALECHGAAISEKPYSILVNRSDVAASKSFTLLHEYYHLLLRSGDNLFLCDNFPSTIESKPNQFASLVLVSNDEFLDGLERKGLRKYREFWPDYILDDLSKVFWVSRDVVAIRLEQLGYAYEGFYAERRVEWEKRYRDLSGFALSGRTKKGYAREKIGESTFTLTLQAVRQGLINAGDAASYLGEVRGSKTGIPWNVRVNDIETWLKEAK